MPKTKDYFHKINKNKSEDNIQKYKVQTKAIYLK